MKWILGSSSLERGEDCVQLFFFSTLPLARILNAKSLFMILTFCTMLDVCKKYVYRVVGTRARLPNVMKQASMAAQDPSPAPKTKAEKKNFFCHHCKCLVFTITTTHKERNNNNASIISIILPPTLFSYNFLIIHENNNYNSRCNNNKNKNKRFWGSTTTT